MFLFGQLILDTIQNSKKCFFHFSMNLLPAISVVIVLKFIDHQLCADTSLVLLCQIEENLKPDKATQNLSLCTIDNL